MAAHRIRHVNEKTLTPKETKYVILQNSLINTGVLIRNVNYRASAYLQRTLPSFLLSWLMSQSVTLTCVLGIARRFYQWLSFFFIWWPGNWCHVEIQGSWNCRFLFQDASDISYDGFIRQYLQKNVFTVFSLVFRKLNKIISVINC